MSENREIKALLNLLDDPDEDVYKTVSERIVAFGRDIIPSLEQLWETSGDTGTQERIEILIHRVHMRELSAEFTEWKNGSRDLLQGALLVARYHYPDLAATPVLQLIEKMRRNIWLELNNYLTPMEKVNVFNSIFYNYYKHEGVEVSYDSPDTFLINKTLETRKGNSISNGVLYLILCELLDLPVKAVNIPRQFILGYMDEQYPLLNPVGHSSERIILYVDPLNGQMYSYQDVEKYFKRISVHPTASYFRPLNNLQIISFLLEELAKCFDNDRNTYKMDELQALAALLGE